MKTNFKKEDEDHFCTFFFNLYFNFFCVWKYFFENIFVFFCNYFYNVWTFSKFCFSLLSLSPGKEGGNLSPLPPHLSTPCINSVVRASSPSSPLQQPREEKKKSLFAHCPPLHGGGGTLKEEKEEEEDPRRATAAHTHKNSFVPTTAYVERRKRERDEKYSVYSSSKPTTPLRSKIYQDHSSYYCFFLFLLLPLL